MQFDVRSDIKAFTGWMNGVQRKQLPFALAGALTSTAFDVRKQIVDKTFPRDFNLKNKSFPKTIFRVEKATKRNLIAAVFDRKELDYLALQAKGGVKTAKDGRTIAVPTQHLKRLKSGKIAKSKRPRPLVDTPKVFIRREGSKGQIVQRAKGKAKGIKVLYQLTPSAKIPKRLNFYEDASAIARKNLRRNFNKSFDRAIKSARR